MNNYQLYRTNVLLGGQMKYDLILSQNSNNHNIDIKDIHITPISNNAPYNKYVDDDVLNYNHIENIKTFYKKTSGSFYKTFINPALNNLYPLPDEYNKESKETTYEMGCRRKSNQLYDKQFEFLCPVWLEQISNFEDLSFEIQIKTSPTAQNIITKKIVFEGKLAKYFDDYTKLLGLYDGYDWVFNISKQNCIVSGVDVKNGTCKELRLSNFYNDLLYRERPLLEVNNLIINELNKHNLITRQLFNFNLCFNISDILGFYTFNQLKDYPLYINVVVCINDKPLDLRDIFSNHEYIDKPISEIPTLSINNGEISISEERSGINVLDYLNDNRHIDLVDKNKILQNTCHWEYSNIKGSIFNLYDGFCGVFKAVDNTGTGGDSGNTGTGGDSGNTGTGGTSPIPDIIYNYPSGDNILVPGVIAWPFGVDYVHEDSNEGIESAYADKIYEKLFDLLNHKEPPTEEEKDEFDDYFTDLSYDLYHWTTFSRITIPDVGEVGPVKLLLVSLNCSCNNNHERGRHKLTEFANYVKNAHNDPTSYPLLDSKYNWNVLPVPNSQDSSNGSHGYIFYSNDYNEIIAIQHTAVEWGWEPKNDNSDYVSSWFEITEWIKMYKLYERISETGEQYPYPYNKINMVEILHNTRILRELIQIIMHRWYVECTWPSKSSKTAIKPISTPQPQQFKYYNSKYYNGFSTDLNMTNINEVGYPYWCNAYKVQNLCEILCDMINDTSRYQNLFSTFSQNCVVNNINYHTPTKDMQNIDDIDVIMLQTNFDLTEDELSQLNKRITEIHINGVRKWHAYSDLYSSDSSNQNITTIKNHGYGILCSDIERRIIILVDINNDKLNNFLYRNLMNLYASTSTETDKTNTFFGSDLFKDLCEYLSTANRSGFEIVQFSNRLTKKLANSPAISSKEIEYFKINTPHINKSAIARSFGKIKPYFIKNNAVYKNYTYSKMKYKELELQPQAMYKMYKIYSQTLYEPRFPSIGYFAFKYEDVNYDDLDKIDAKVAEFHNYTINKILHLEPILEKIFTRSRDDNNTEENLINQCIKDKYKALLSSITGEKHDEYFNYIKSKYILNHSSIESIDVANDSYNYKIQLKLK